MPRYNYNSTPEATAAPGFTKHVLPDGEYDLLIRDVQVREAGLYRITEFKLMDVDSGRFHDYSVLRKMTDAPNDEAGSPSLHIRKLGVINKAIHGTPINFDDESQEETEHVFIVRTVRATIKARTYTKRDGTTAVDNDPRDWTACADPVGAQKRAKAHLPESILIDLRERKNNAAKVYNGTAPPPPPPVTPDTFDDDEIPF